LELSIYFQRDAWLFVCILPQKFSAAILTNNGKMIIVKLGLTLNLTTNIILGGS